MLTQSQPLALGPLRPPPQFILQNGEVTTQEYVRTVLTLDSTLNAFENDGGSARFEANMASALGVNSNDVQVMSIRSGSVILDYNVYVPRGGSLDDLLASQQAVFAEGGMDLGYPILGVALSSGGSTGPPLSVITDGVIADSSVLGYLGRSLDPESVDDNCLKCLAPNEAVKNFQTDQELWAGSSQSNFKFTVFCEKEDLSASRCCEASYNSEGILRFFGESASDEICTLGLCSLSELESQMPVISDYFQMYQKCFQI